MNRAIVRGVVIGSLLIGLGGCTTYYRISDPSTGKTYYTTGMSQTGQGAVKFKDANSGAEVTIQNSTVSTIDKTQYEEGLRVQAAESVKQATPSTR